MQVQSIFHAAENVFVIKGQGIGHGQVEGQLALAPIVQNAQVVDGGIRRNAVGAFLYQLPVGRPLAVLGDGS